VAEELTLGHFDQADFAGLYLLEDGPGTAAEKVTLAERLLARRPGLTPARLHLGKNLARAGREKEARAALREGLEAGPDPDVRSRMQVELATLTGDTAECERLYREAAAPGGNLVAAAAAEVALRARS
jgi:predicted Zn-dependent protease